MTEERTDIVIDHIPSSESIVTAVVEAVMTASGADELPEEPLYDSVDPDILKWIVDGDSDRTVRVAFEYAGFEVTVRGDRTLTVIPAGDDDPLPFDDNDIAERYREQNGE